MNTTVNNNIIITVNSHILDILKMYHKNETIELRNHFFHKLFNQTFKLKFFEFN